MFFKLGIIAFCWAIMAVQIPLNEASITLSAGIMTIEFLSVALFIFALCIPFEIRDIQLEFSRGIKTIPVVYGIRVAKTSGFLALLISMFLQIYKFSQDLFSAYTLIALMISLFITMLIVLLSAEKPSDMYCKFFVDGIMILQFILVFLSLSL
jgi:4-hydroxybenzoate polyprenyltransferase